jgi:hypothetical protein
VTLRVADGKIKVRGRLSTELLDKLRAHKDDLLRLLSADEATLACRCCSAPPRSDEIGGFDLQGWRCEECLDAAGIEWRDEPEKTPELPCPKTAPLGRCRRCRFTAPLHECGVCGRCLWRHPADARASDADSSSVVVPFVRPQDRTAASDQQLLTRVLKRLERKHPDGVEEAMLKSWFIYELASERERAGLPKLSPRQNTKCFEQALRKIGN